MCITNEYVTYVTMGCNDTVVECLTRDREAAGTSLNGCTALSPSARHFILCLVLVQHRILARPDKKNCCQKDSKQKIYVTFGFFFWLFLKLAIHV